MVHKAPKVAGLSLSKVDFAQSVWRLTGKIHSEAEALSVASPKDREAAKVANLTGAMQQRWVGSPAGVFSTRLMLTVD